VSTLKDIAKNAGVSVCTVSRYINRKIKVKADTAKKIDHAIEYLHYIPNNAAKTLKTNFSSNVALLIPTLANLLFAESAHEIETVFRQNDFSVFIYGFENDIRREKAVIPRLIENRVAGVLFNTLPSNYEDFLHLRSLDRNGIPYVFLNRMFSPIPIPSVYVDYYKAAYDATSYLIESGRKQVAIMLGRLRQPQSHINYLGYTSALRERRRDLSPDTIFECDYDSNQIPALVERALSEKIDAFYCLTDLIAIHVIHALRALGRRVPEDVAVIGAGNTTFATLMDPQLTTVDLKNRLLGRSGAQLLLDIIKKCEHQQTIILEPNLIFRGTA
jgi:LacI family transcriptional regulator